MSEENIDAETVIERLGGPTKTAAICEVSKSAVSQWKTNGIPKAQRKFLCAVRPEIFDSKWAPPATSPAPDAGPDSSCSTT